VEHHTALARQTVHFYLQIVDTWLVHIVEPPVMDTNGLTFSSTSYLGVGYCYKKVKHLQKLKYCYRVDTVNGSRPVQTLVCRRRGLLMLIAQGFIKVWTWILVRQEVHSLSIGNGYACTF